MRRRLLALLCGALILTVSGCIATTSGDMLQAADDLDLMCDRIETGDVSCTQALPVIREHTRTLRAWAGADE